MSRTLLKLCKKILQEHFGDIVADVGDILLKRAPCTLPFLLANSTIPRAQVKEALCVLTKHNLVKWEESKPNVASYILLTERILLILRFPRYVRFIRERYGEEMELIVDIILKEGQVTASKIIILACLRYFETQENPVQTSVGDRHRKVQNFLASLVENQFVEKAPSPDDGSKAVPLLISDNEKIFCFDTTLVNWALVLNEIEERLGNPDPFQNGSIKISTNHPDSGVYWRLNYDRFHLMFRDQEILQSISRRIGIDAGLCLEAAFKASYKKCNPWEKVLNIITCTEIKEHQKNLSHLSHNLKNLCDDGGGCLSKLGDAGGGEYAVNIEKIVNTITLSILDHIVQERYGSKAARIFRIVREYGMMEQDHIAELCMSDKKEAIALSNKLVLNRFLRLHELRKNPIPTPMCKHTLLFYFDLNSVVRMCLEWLYKSLYNVMTVRELKLAQNRRLLDKTNRTDTIIEQLKQTVHTPEQIEELEQVVTPNERNLVEKILTGQDRLLGTEMDLDKMLYPLQLQMYYFS